MTDDDDRIAGVAIDLADINTLLLKWFGGGYHDIVKWKEKAKNWDNFVDGKYINDVSIWKEKAMKYDELQLEHVNWKELIRIEKDYKDLISGSHQFSISTSKKHLEELEEKAKKLDELKSDYDALWDDLQLLQEKNLNLENEVNRLKKKGEGRLS